MRGLTRERASELSIERTDAGEVASGVQLLWMHYDTNFNKPGDMKSIHRSCR